MASMDFSVLSDDQLVELIRGAWSEASKRGRAATSASKQAVMDESEKYRVTRTATEREIERQKRLEEERIAEEAAKEIRRQVERQKKEEEQKKINELWKAKDQISKTFYDLLRIYSDSTLKIWSNDKGTDIRIYINSDRKKTRRGYRFEELVYYHTGNQKYKPGTMEVDSLHKGEEVELKAACIEICKNWTKLIVDIPAFKDQEEQVNEK